MIKPVLITNVIIWGLIINCKAYTPIQFGPLQSDRYFQNTGGKVDHISPLLINKTQASDIQNLTMDDRGKLSKRNGYTVLGSTGVLISTGSTNVVLGGSYHKSASGSDFFAVVVGTDVYRTGNSYTGYTQITGAITLTNNAVNYAQVTHLQDQAVFCNEQDKPFYVGASGNAITISTNTFDKAKTCATYGVYLVVGNTTESSVAFPNRIRWSDATTNAINSFPALNFIDVEPNDGDKIVGIVSYEESVYIFKQRTIYRMLITGLDGPDAFIIRPYARNIGAYGKMTIKAIPNVGIAFLSQQTAYLLNNNGLTPIGDPIQRTFDNIQASQWSNAVAEVYPQRYQYQLWVSTAGSTNTQGLIYDYLQNNWTIYSGMTISMLSQALNSSGKQILISGDTSHVTYLQDNGLDDNPNGVKTAITSYYTTAILTQDTPELTKGYKYLYIVTSGDAPSTLTINEAYDFNSTYEHTDTVTAGSSAYGTAVYDTDTYTQANIASIRLELNRDAKAIQLKFTNNGLDSFFGLIGWTLVYQPEDYRQ